MCRLKNTEISPGVLSGTGVFLPHYSVSDAILDLEDFKVEEPKVDIQQQQQPWSSTCKSNTASGSSSSTCFDQPQNVNRQSYQSSHSAAAAAASRGYQSLDFPLCCNAPIADCAVEGRSQSLPAGSISNGSSSSSRILCVHQLSSDTICRAAEFSLSSPRMQQQRQQQWQHQLHLCSDDVVVSAGTSPKAAPSPLFTPCASPFQVAYAGSRYKHTPLGSTSSSKRRSSPFSTIDEEECITASIWLDQHQQQQQHEFAEDVAALGCDNNSAGYGGVFELSRSASIPPKPVCSKSGPTPPDSSSSRVVRHLPQSLLQSSLQTLPAAAAANAGRVTGMSHDNRPLETSTHAAAVLLASVAALQRQSDTEVRWESGCGTHGTSVAASANLCGNSLYCPAAGAHARQQQQQQQCMRACMSSSSSVPLLVPEDMAALQQQEQWDVTGSRPNSISCPMPYMSMQRQQQQQFHLLSPEQQDYIRMEHIDSKLDKLLLLKTELARTQLALRNKLAASKISRLYHGPTLDDKHHAAAAAASGNSSSMAGCAAAFSAIAAANRLLQEAGLPAAATESIDTAVPSTDSHNLYVMPPPPPPAAAAAETTATCNDAVSVYLSRHLQQQLSHQQCISAVQQGLQGGSMSLEAQRKLLQLLEIQKAQMELQDEFLQMLP